MREIKFRAWDARSIKGRMIKVRSLQFNDWVNVNGDVPLTLMQYTGLKDKNGVEIYEGDVVNVPYGHHKYNANDESYDDKVLYFVPCQIAFNEWRGFYPNPLYGKKKMQQLVGKRQQSLWGIVREDEIIGNIYENPELLQPSVEGEQS